MIDGHEPIDLSESIYRRVFEAFYNPGKVPALSQKAFNPIDGNDDDGISVTRGRYGSGPEEVAASGYVGKKYYVVQFTAKDLLDIGAIVQPDPDEAGNIGHALIPAINCRDRDSDAVQNMMEQMRNLSSQVYGPFDGKQPAPKRR